MGPPLQVIIKNWLATSSVRPIRVAAADRTVQSPTLNAFPTVPTRCRRTHALSDVGAQPRQSGGRNIDDSPLVIRKRDARHPATPTERGFLPMPWRDRRQPCSDLMFTKNGRPYAGPRHAGARCGDRYKSRGRHRSCAARLNLLIDDSGRKLPVPPVAAVGTAARRLKPSSIRGARPSMNSHRPYDACEKDGISPPIPAISEQSGQSKSTYALVTIPARRRDAVVPDAGQRPCRRHVLCREALWRNPTRITLRICPTRISLCSTRTATTSLTTRPPGTAISRPRVAG